MRERIFSIIEKSKSNDDHISKFYDCFIIITAFVSVSPLMFKDTNSVLIMIDTVTVYILYTDYIFRWMTHDLRRNRPGDMKQFLLYPFTFTAIIDLVSLLPSLNILNGSFRVLRLLRITKIIYYSNSMTMVANVFKKERKTLMAVLLIALFYIFVSALVMFTEEPSTFGSFFDALYWATTALTTVGYGDIYPRSDLGQLISMISSLFGIAIIALPSGIVTAGFVDEVKQSTEKKNQKKEGGAND